MSEVKKCTRCKELKQYSEFNQCKSGRFGLHNHCRMCQKEVRRNWYIKNQEIELAKSKEYSKSEKGKIVRDRSYLLNKDKLLKRNRIARSTPHARNLANIARKKMLDNNISFKISQNLRSRLRLAIINGDGVKYSRTLELLGCSIEEFRLHLESKFISGMSWENYGYKGWHIDHIKPCCLFDLKQEDQVKQCFHYTNMQPLWWQDNFSKGSKFKEN